MNLRKPLLIYDGECRFCCRWVERWKGVTGDRVEYEVSQTAGVRFPQISAEEFGRAVQLVRVDGTVVSGAEAVLTALAEGSVFWPWVLEFYRTQGWFARVLEEMYGVVAENRMAFSRVTRLLWGDDVRRPAYAVSSRVFLHLLGAIYLVAFWSYWVQVDGLVGEQGIVPAGRYFAAVHEALGASAYWQMPSLCWLGASGFALKMWCAAGVVAALLLCVGIAPAWCLVFLWVDYLSLTGAEQVFYQFQWDALLLEAGFMAIFLAPWGWRLRTMNPPGAARFLMVWLLARLMFASGVVKLLSGDDSWWNGTALDFHYYTQPLPTVAAWWAEQMPEWTRWASVKVMFAIELGMPFLLFAPRRLRMLAVGGLLLLQGLIALTGNYGFFNLLTAALCVMAVDDRWWGRWGNWKVAEARGYMNRWVLGVVAAVIFCAGLVPTLLNFGTGGFWLKVPVVSEAWVWSYGVLNRFEMVNSYGLFAGMTKVRREITIQHSEDGVTWEDYEFRYKPGDVKRAPGWMAPYMPRLDWQMWFAALGDAEGNPWFTNLMVRLLEGSTPVEGLLAGPMPEKPPRYVRAVSGDYTFTTRAEREKTGAWWKVEPAAEYFPKASLRGE
ncbi:lipase maturation factor family protein [soil metagenome]